MFDFITGFIRLKISEKSISGFINSCKRKNIPLYNIQRKNDSFFIDVKGKECKDAIATAKECGMEAGPCGRIGLLMRLVLYKSRKAFFAVLLILVLYYGVNYCYISEIVINGNNIFTDSQITECLKINDVYVGRLKFGIDPLVFQNCFIQTMPEVSWIWIEIDGTKAIVNLKERVTKPEFYDYSIYGNIVAAKDGVIKSAVASRGQTVVSEGMFVRKGDILINGVYGSEKDTKAGFVNAEGKVMASTSYTLSDEFSCNYIKYTALPDTKSKFGASIGNVKLWEDKPNDGFSVVLEEKKARFKIFGKNYLPLAFTKTKYCEIIRSEYTPSRKIAIDDAYNELVCRIKRSLGDGAVVTNIKKSSTPPIDGKFTASVTAECIEDIATRLPIEVVAE